MYWKIISWQINFCLTNITHHKPYDKAIVELRAQVANCLLWGQKFRQLTEKPIHSVFIDIQCVCPSVLNLSANIVMHSGEFKVLAKVLP